jgi:undecaprenyl-diphosphatase
VSRDDRAGNALAEGIAMNLVVLAKAALLGIVEGATEFIPVSFTGHLILVQNWLNFVGQKENAFMVFIQLGAILAVVWLYRVKFWTVLRNLLTEFAAQRFVLNLIIGMLPAVVIGLPTDDWIEAHLFKPVPVAFAFAIGGVLILLIERRQQAPTIPTVDDIPFKTALFVGFFQVLAVLFPGLSRSGATIMGGLLVGLSRQAAAEFSFFLAIPAMCGASLIKLIQARDVLSTADIPMFGVGFVVAFLVALLVIRALVAFVSKHAFTPFAWYRMAFGVLLVALYWNRLSGF